MTPGEIAELRKAVECRCDAYHTAHRCDVVEDLLDEIERLHAELANHKRQLPDALENAEDHGAEKERAAIVAWLLQDATAEHGRFGSPATIMSAAHAIERGEHVK